LVDNLVFDSLRHSKTNLGKDFFTVKARRNYRFSLGWCVQRSKTLRGSCSTAQAAWNLLKIALAKRFSFGIITLG
jgi:hypothetical protein